MTSNSYGGSLRCREDAARLACLRHRKVLNLGAALAAAQSQPLFILSLINSSI